MPAPMVGGAVARVERDGFGKIRGRLVRGSGLHVDLRPPEVGSAVAGVELDGLVKIVECFAVEFGVFAAAL